ncbi:VOC family protein [Propioniciclava soli]|uniref:VOC family protein n=1 Tax=Propioniciclava soli TaxID=2775081 RepID=A0ABZ3C346_9ACTN|nr:VOC family protein [Propioniciclava soli]
MSDHPRLVQTVLDTPRPRELAEFYRALLGYEYRAGDEPPAHGQPDDADWLVLRDPAGGPQLAFQLAAVEPTTWPDARVPMQLHLDMTVPDADALVQQRDRAVALGAAVRLDRSNDAEEPLYVMTDPAGHPFCLFVG